jgi:hypothetical protein
VWVRSEDIEVGRLSFAADPNDTDLRDMINVIVEGGADEKGKGDRGVTSEGASKESMGGGGGSASSVFQKGKDRDLTKALLNEAKRRLEEAGQREDYKLLVSDLDEDADSQAALGPTKEVLPRNDHKSRPTLLSGEVFQTAMTVGFLSEIDELGNAVFISVEELAEREMQAEKAVSARQSNLRSSSSIVVKAVQVPPPSPYGKEVGGGPSNLTDIGVDYMDDDNRPKLCANGHFLQPGFRFCPACGRQAASNIEACLQKVAASPFRVKWKWCIKQMQAFQIPWEYGRLIMRVTRLNLLEDSFEVLMKAQKEDLHKWLRIEFSDEPGLDAGGLGREWFTLVTETLFDESLGLFQITVLPSFLPSFI